MNCPECGAKSHVLETRSGEHFTIRRRRQCLNEHKFWSIEAAESGFHKTNMKRAAHGIRIRHARWARDVQIAKDMHKGYKLLAKEYGLTPDMIVKAARRARIALIRGNA